MKTKTENTEQRDWPSIEEQKQYWKDKEAASDNATNETRVADALSLLIRTVNDLLRHPQLLSTFEALEDCVKSSNQVLSDYRDSRAASNLSKVDSTTADPKPEDDLSRTEATTQFFDDLDEREKDWSLRDEGRSDGQGESYSERNS